MSWLGWAVICIIAANVVLFGAAFIWYLIDEKDRRKRK